MIFIIPKTISYFTGSGNNVGWNYIQITPKDKNIILDCDIFNPAYGGYKPIRYTQLFNMTIPEFMEFHEQLQKSVHISRYQLLRVECKSDGTIQFITKIYQI